MKCVPQNDESIEKLFDDSQTFMKELYSKKKQAGGNKTTTSPNQGDKKVTSFIKIGGSLNTNSLKERNKNKNMKEERLKAAAAISYIFSLFVKGKKEKVDVLRKYYNNKPYNMELNDVMYTLASYIKNTRPE